MRTVVLEERIELIEDEVKTLVSVLEKIPYMTNIKEDVGHYWSSDSDKHYTSLTFNIEKGYETDFLQLADLILKRTNPYSSKAEVEINKGFFIDEATLEIKEKWKLLIKPYNLNATQHKKIKLTAEVIMQAIEAAKEYERERRDCFRRTIYKKHELN
jgi:hypothetical protein